MYVPLPARRTEAAHYVYPEHLRPQIALLLRAPGVYVFLGESGPVPLYIGKSVDIRHRVMDHMRTPQEARLLRKTQRIEFARTAGDLGAQLLEAQQIKLRQPVHNKLLRRRRDLYSIRLLRGRPEVVHSAGVRFSSAQRLYGLYSSRRAALHALRAVADDNRLCYGLLGDRAAGRRAPLLPGHDRPLRGRLRRARTAGRARGPAGGGAAGAAGRGLAYAGRWGWDRRGGCRPDPDPRGTRLALPGQRRNARPCAPAGGEVGGFDNDGYRILSGPVLAG